MSTVPITNKGALQVTLARQLFAGSMLLCGLCAPVSVLSVLDLSLFSSLSIAQTEKPEWCKPLPRPEYKSLERVLPDDPWFEVYKVAPAVFPIYDPHQSEEIIS